MAEKEQDVIGKDLGGLPLLLIPAFIGIVLGVILPNLRGMGLWFWLGIALLAAIGGTCLLAYTRLPLYHKGKFFSIGPRELPKDRLPLYKWAWRLIGIGIFLLSLLLFIVKN